MTQRALVFMPYGSWDIHVATSLEIAQQYLDADWEVTLLCCPGSLAACDVKHQGTSTLACWHCKVGQRRASRMLTGPVRRIDLPKQGAAAHMDASALLFSSLEQLLEFKVDNFEVGEAVYSSLVSEWWTNSIDVDFESPVVQADIRDACASCLFAYAEVKQLLKQEHFDAAVVFNGRIATMRAFLRACETAGVPYWVHERGANVSRFLRTHNAMPHERKSIATSIRDSCSEAPYEDRAAIAKAFYTDRRHGIIHNWRSFTDGQTPDLLPLELAAGIPVISLFLTTQTEMVGLGDEWRTGLYASQDDGVEQIASAVAQGSQDFVVVIRAHPNQRNLRELARIRAFCESHEGSILVEPDSPIDSYALAARSDRVVTFGSTIGVEASYWGKPVISAAPSAYSGLGAVYEPNTHDELVTLLLQRDLDPLAPSGAIDYGYWCSSFGERFRYAEEAGVGGRVTFAGRPLRRSPGASVRRVIRHFGLVG
jgi:hypothetical protein